MELETEEPEGTMEILFGMGAISSSFCEAGKAQRFRVMAQFDHAIDLPRCSAILMSALDLPELPTVRSKGLGQGTWIDHFPLCDGFEVRLPCHNRDSGRKRRVVYLEGSTAFGAGRGLVPLILHDSTVPYLITFNGFKVKRLKAMETCL